MLVMLIVRMTSSDGTEVKEGSSDTEGTFLSLFLHPQVIWKNRMSICKEFIN